MPAPIASLCIVEMGARGASSASGAQLYLNIGLQNGVLLRTVLDGLTGELSDTRTRFVGTRPVRLERVSVAGESGLLALSSRTWLCYNWQSRYQVRRRPRPRRPADRPTGRPTDRAPPTTTR